MGVPVGIETALLIGGLVAAGVGTGVQVHQSQVAAGQAKDAQHKQEAAVRQQQSALADQTAKNDATTAARTARLRQKALLGSMQGNDQTIGTSPLGLAGNASGGAGNPGSYGGGTKTTLGA